MDDLALTFSVFDGSSFVVSDGVTMGETLANPRPPLCDDIYAVTPHAPLARAMYEDEKLHLAQCGTPLRPCRALTFMDDAGGTLRCFQLVSTDARVFILSLDQPNGQARYRLIHSSDTTLASLMDKITFGILPEQAMVKMRDGSDRAVGALKPGDEVLAVNDDACTVLQVRKVASRACAADGLVKVPAQTLGNRRDLILHPHQTIIDGTALIRADQLVSTPHASIDKSADHRLVQLRCDQNAIVVVDGIRLSVHLCDRGPIADVPPARINPGSRKTNRQTA
ncbi:hypothetical protein [Yoonia sp. 2307UL14-13]|uniref:hypothetical protein n=1 Tax=Yoonia sp. 2307UL14-13 TaxID=3126506 RepID=UPI0030A4104F